jgi:hypothetical protein
MSTTIALCMQELETRGWTVVEGCLSPQLQRHLARGYPNPNPSEMTLVRQAFDGLPMRITQGIVGEVILSQIKYGAEPNWHRGRYDTINSGAPPDFIPGFDLACILDGQPCQLEVIPGSGRLRANDPCPVGISQEVELRPGDLVILDSRLQRLWPQKRDRWVFWFSVIRPWLTPLNDFSMRLRPETPPRALRFFGIPQMPPRDVGEWLFRTHRKGED